MEYNNIAGIDFRSAVLIAVGAIVLLWVIITFNRLVRLRNNREQASANIDAHLAQRMDMIPELVNVVKGYASHEQETLRKIMKLRSKGLAAQSTNEKMDVDRQLTHELSRIFMNVEAYPNLKADRSFIHLQHEISDVENKLAASRRYFNSATKEFNSSQDVFPDIIVARVFGFRHERMFEVDAMKRTENVADLLKF